MGTRVARIATGSTAAARDVMMATTMAIAMKRSAAAAAAVATQQPTGLPALVRGFAVKKKAAKKGKKGGEDANFELMLRTLRGRYPDVEPFTEEEKARHAEIAIRYNRMTSIRHNHHMRDLQTKIDLKWAAINALPAELQAEAMEIDDAPVPEERSFATWTPPIEGFFRQGTDDEMEM